MTRIAILGSGNVARALAGPLAANGHPVVVGSRTPDGLSWDDDGVAVASPADAVAGAEIVVNALPGAVSLPVLVDLGPSLAGRILVDVANGVRIGADGFATSLLHPGSSLAERIQAALPTTRVVKALNTMHVSLMADPGSLPTPPTVFVSGDHPDARRATGMLLADLGWRPEWVVDLGGLASARWTETFPLVVRPLVHALGPVPFGLAIAR
ncbi:NAD(P)-binding domain-containing protein [Micromonospora sp. NBC_01699]|uniref:NADPH-dependent F420 reductase n=1 Tax=Micromonospora sp. NBC_01699 TaxID=2975984 RepID=UPI002E2A2CC2|nr:NAD(P)-binding domain-containing protein [Micromonospora sp. NBC_01699]